MVNNLPSDQYDITVQSIYDVGDLSQELAPSIHYQSIVKTKNMLSFQLAAYFVRRIISPKVIADLFIKSGYDIENAYLEGESTRLIASHVSQSRKIAWVHVNMNEIFTSQGLYRSIDEHKAIYKKFSKVICVSEGARRGFFQRFGEMENVEVLYNVIDGQLIHKKAEEHVEYQRRDGLNLLMVGNFRKEKAYDRMLSVSKKLNNEGYSFHLTILGSGAEFNSISALREELDLSQVVDMPGSIRNPYPYMKQADLLVCSSKEEAFSTVVIEACILGLPTLTTDCAGMDEILDKGKYGMIVENSVEGLYQGLKTVLEDPSVIAKYRAVLPERISYFSKEKRIQETILMLEG